MARNRRQKTRLLFLMNNLIIDNSDSNSITDNKAYNSSYNINKLTYLLTPSDSPESSTGGERG